MSKNIICIAARLNSTRLPNKALLDLKGKPAIWHLIERLKKVRNVKQIVLCTSSHKDDSRLVDIAIETGIDFIEGDENDVLSRFYMAILRHNADNVIRITGDDILIDYDILDFQLGIHCLADAEYTFIQGMPNGTQGEIISKLAINKIFHLVEDTSLSEYMSYYFNNTKYFKVECLNAPSKLFNPKIRLTLDYIEDYIVLKSIFDELYDKNRFFKTNDIIKLYDLKPELFKPNQNIKTESKIKKEDIKFL